MGGPGSGRRKALPQPDSTTTTTTTIALTDEQPPALADPLVYALDAGQMRTAQQRMLAWLDQRMTAEEQRRAELQENFDIATANRWRTQAIYRALQHVIGKLEFYGKFKAAVEAGYQPIPDLRMDIFAVRTRRTTPKKQYNESVSPHSWDRPTVDDEPAQCLPIGAGEYRNPSQIVRRGTHTETRDGKEVKVKVVFTDRFQEHLDFPFTMVKPALLNEAQRALVLKVFDEVGVIHPRHNVGKDPIIAGRILNPRRYGRAALFLIGWYVDMREWN